MLTGAEVTKGRSKYRGIPSFVKIIFLIMYAKKLTHALNQFNSHGAADLMALRCEVTDFNI